MSQTYKLEWEEHKARGQEHQCTMTVLQKVLLMKSSTPIPEVKAVVKLVNTVAVYARCVSFSQRVA